MAPSPGGADNLRGAGAATARLRVDLADPAAVDEEALSRLGARPLTWPASGVLHVLLPTRPAASRALAASAPPP